MKLKLILCALLVFSVIISCKKKEPQALNMPVLPTSTTTSGSGTTNTVTPTNTVAPVPPDTVKPRSYFPAYPGSSWNYINESGHVVTHTTAPTYVLYKYISAGGSYDHQIRYDSSYVPIYNNVAIYGYSIRYSRGNYADPPTGLFPFLQETTGPCYIYPNYHACNQYVQSPCIGELITTVSAKVNANGDSVLVMHGSFKDFYGHLGPGANYPNQVTIREYTKNIGLTFYCRVDTLQNDTLEKLKITSYYIAPH